MVTMKLRRSAPFALILILGLVGTQGFGAAHGVDHLVAPDDVICGLCLAQHQCKQALLPACEVPAVQGQSPRQTGTSHPAFLAVFSPFHFARAPPRPR